MGSLQSSNMAVLSLQPFTSCTNTSNPSAMLGAGLVGKRACELDIVGVSALSGNRKSSFFDRANYLASPPSGVAYALADTYFNLILYGVCAITMVQAISRLLLPRDLKMPIRRPRHEQGRAWATRGELGRARTGKGVQGRAWEKDAYSQTSPRAGASLGNQRRAWASKDGQRLARTSMGERCLFADLATSRGELGQPEASMGEQGQAKPCKDEHGRVTR
ncbi:hypothetical protein KSP40_PGU022660 [Platanthera guangdongensis]|uniref:Uncharacterized protein n=1 Tax=Platanthera guangdongensis TaxID=2320717 RepID=A0ABR2M4Y5_9ASPA